jgi:hypothetical protein
MRRPWGIMVNELLTSPAVHQMPALSMARAQNCFYLSPAHSSRGAFSGLQLAHSLEHQHPMTPAPDGQSGRYSA